MIEPGSAGFVWTTPRIAAVADSLDAMTSQRPYRAGRSLEDDNLRENEGMIAKLKRALAG